MFASHVLENQTALITGGGTGLGKAMAKMLASQGARVCIASRSSEHLESTAAEIREAGGQVLPLVCDVRKPDNVQRTVDDMLREWGQLDILINNAAGNFIVPSEDLSPAGWKAVIDIVLNGTYYCTHAAGKQMIRQQSGKILNIIATYAWTGNAGTIHSAAAKGGVLALTRTLAVEWARYNIRVNALAPGPVDTAGAREKLWAFPEAAEYLRRQIPQKRFGSEEEVSLAALYLLSPYADFITGEVLVIDGGLWLNRTMFDMERMAEISEMYRRGKKE